VEDFLPVNWGAFAVGLFSLAMAGLLWRSRQPLARLYASLFPVLFGRTGELMAARSTPSSIAPAVGGAALVGVVAIVLSVCAPDSF
jgi:hypothetical protein